MGAFRACGCRGILFTVMLGVGPDRGAVRSATMKARQPFVELPLFRGVVVTTSATSALTKALKLADWGLPVFLCAATKRPTCPHGFKEATRDATALRALWREYPGQLIGVPTGAVTGIFVLDVDTAKHDTAAEWLERYASYLPETRSHRTRSGGLHLLFKHRGGLRNSQAKLALGIDTRGDGGFILWWPAAIEHGHHRAPLAELPDWLVEALTPPKPETRPAVQRPKTPEAAKAKIEGIVGAVAAACEGQRNGLTYWGACRLAELVKQAVIAHGDGCRHRHRSRKTGRPFTKRSTAHGCERISGAAMTDTVLVDFVSNAREKKQKRAKWLDKCIKSETGKPMPVLANALIGLRAEMPETFAYDEMLCVTMLMGPVDGPNNDFTPRPCSDVDVGVVQENMQHSSASRVSAKT